MAGIARKAEKIVKINIFLIEHHTNKFKQPLNIELCEKRAHTRRKIYFYHPIRNT